MEEFEVVKSASATYHHQGDHVAHVDAAWFALKPTFHEAHYFAYYLHRREIEEAARWQRVLDGEEDW